MTNFGGYKIVLPRLTKYCRGCIPSGVDAPDRANIHKHKTHLLAASVDVLLTVPTRHSQCAWQSHHSSLSDVASRLKFYS